MNCPTCGGGLELGTGGTYARCTKCFALFMNLNGALTPYPVDASMRTVMEQALGFAPSQAAPKAEPPKICSMPICQGTLERIDDEGETYTRCPKCGLLSTFEGNFLVPLIVDAPGGGWDAEFQAIFEEQLGFKKRVRRNPPGVVGA